MTRIGVDLVTKMHDGKHMGCYLHRVRACDALLLRVPLLTFTLRAQECALIYYKANPLSMNGAVPNLIFKTPPAPVMHFAQSFANREIPLARVQMTVSFAVLNPCSRTSPKA